MDGSAADTDWKAKLTPEQYRVLREHGTERAGTSELNAEKRDGVYHCAACGTALFDASTKYDSGSGWPSFYEAMPETVEFHEDRSMGMVRTEVRCKTCHGHLGHVFPDGPRPTGQRFCMNGVALAFEPK